MFIKKKPFIIAEAGVNHNGNLDIAKRLIVGAKKAGVDAIKFQSFITENLTKKMHQKYPIKLIKKKSLKPTSKCLKN